MGKVTTSPQQKPLAAKAAKVVKPRKASSKYRGVCWLKERKAWRARIEIAGKREHLGYFSSEREAALAYDKRARMVLRKRTRLNFPELSDEKENERKKSVVAPQVKTINKERSLDIEAANLLASTAASVSPQTVIPPFDMNLKKQNPMLGGQFALNNTLATYLALLNSSQQQPASLLNPLFLSQTQSQLNGKLNNGWLLDNTQKNLGASSLLSLPQVQFSSLYSQV